MIYTQIMMNKHRTIMQKPEIKSSKTWDTSWKILGIRTVMAFNSYKWEYNYYN